VNVGAAGIRERLAAGHRQLLTGSVVLVAGAAVQALGGSLFWLIAARIDLKAEVGAATALFTSVQFVTYVAGLGLPVALARYAVGRDDDADTIFTWGSIATVAAGIVASLAYVGFLWLVHPPSTKVLFHSPGPWIAAFVVMVVGSALSLIVDVRCMTIRRWNLVLLRIALVAVLRLPLIFFFRPDARPALWLFIFSTIPIAATGIVGALLVGRISGGRMRLRPRPATLGPMVRYSAINYISTLAYQAPYFALPVIVLANVDADTNAAFYVAWGIVAVAFYVPYAIGQALLAEGGKEGARFRSQLKVALTLAVGLMTAGAAVTAVGSGLVETVYGHAYHDAARILPPMMLAGIPWAISSLLLTEARVRHRHVATVVITVVLTLAIVVPALVLVPGEGSDHGIDGARDAWLIGNVIAGVVAVLAHLASEWWERRGHSKLVSDAVTPSVVPIEALQ
jgi:O-antigen/teichoic acid export membrane protein